MADTTTAPTKSPRLQTIQTYLSVFSTLDTTPLLSILSPKYHHTMMPSSIPAYGPWDKAGFVAHVSGISKMMTAFHVRAVEVIDSEQDNSLWVWTASDAKWRPEAMDGDEKEWSYQGQNLFMFWFDGEGRVERCVEVVDSLKSVNVLVPLFQRATVNLGKVVA